MARSTYIYILVDDEGYPQAAGTVRHEMETLIDRSNTPGHHVIRCGDGAAMTADRVSLTASAFLLGDKFPRVLA